MRGSIPRAGGPRPRHATLAILGLLLGTGAVGAASPRLFVVDPAQSQLRFHAGSRFMDATGSFSRFAGEIRLDEARPETGSGRLTIDVASLDTANRLRDFHLRSADFFDVGQHPTATFVTSAVRREAAGWTVTGDLTLRGVTRALTVPVTVSVSRPEGRIRVAGEVTLSRRDLQMTYQSFINPIRDEVRVTFDLVATAE